MVNTNDNSLFFGKYPAKVKRIINYYAEGLDQKSRKPIAYMAKAFVMATLPHSKPKETIFRRQCGYSTLTVSANSAYGLPYGATARWLLIWIVTQAKNLEFDLTRKEHDPVRIVLGASLSQFLKKLKLRNIGGERGSAKQVRQQLLRLLTCTYSYTTDEAQKGKVAHEQFHISRSFQFLWNKSKADLQILDQSSEIVLSSDFFDEIVSQAVPLDLDVLSLIRGSSMQIDIYIWLTYRFFSLSHEAVITWKALQCQFGADYANDAQGLRNFKRKFNEALKVVLLVYPEANVSVIDEGIRLVASQTHVQKQQKRGKRCVNK